jgi:hypothetical protein
MRFSASALDPSNGLVIGLEAVTMLVRAAT